MAGPLQRILVVENDADLRRVVGMALETALPARVKVCPGGPKALDQARRFKPDLLLLDPTTSDFRSLISDVGATSSPSDAFSGLTGRHAPRVWHATHAPWGETVVMGLAKPYDPTELPGAIERCWSSLAAPSPLQ